MRPTSANSGLRGPPLNLCDIIKRGYVSQVHILVSLGANLEARDVTGRTPLMLTAYIQPQDWGVGIALQLIEQGVRMSPRDRHGMNALHHACVYERVQLARVLLNAPDFDLVQTDRFGNTALHYAAMSGNPDLVRLLVSYHHRYRQPLNKINRHGRSARDEAQHAGYHQCVAILDESVTSASACVTQPLAILKDGGLSNRTGSECSSNATSMFFAKDEREILRGVYSGRKEETTVRASRISASGDSSSPRLCVEGAKISEVFEEEEKSPKMSLRREDEEGGLFGGSSDQISHTHHQGEGVEGEGEKHVSNKNLLSPFHTPPTSDRSSDLKPIRSQNSATRMRRSGIRRAHPTAPVSASALTRRLSVGSSSSTRSAGKSMMKQSPASTHGSATTTTATAIANTNNRSTTTGIGACEDQNSSEVLVVGPAREIGFQELAHSPSAQNLRMSNILKENNIILNNMRNTVNTTTTNSMTLQIPKVPRPPLTSSTSSSLGFRMDPALATRPQSSRVPLPYEKDPERVIHIAPEHDFRNTREYVLKLTRMEFSPAHFDATSLPVLVRPSPSVPHVEEGVRKVGSGAGSWRDSIRFLYRHLEYQCSPSWRDAANNPADQLAMAPQWGVTSPSDDGDETKEKKARRPSSSNRPVKQSDTNDMSSSSNVKRKSSTNKQRKISAISSPSGVGPVGDASSSDSLSTGSKKKTDNPRLDPALNRP